MPRPLMVTIMTDMTNRIGVGGGKCMDTWTAADAKAKFSEVMDRARSDGPQTITRKGRPAVVIVAAEEWERKTRRQGNLAEWFAASPLRDSGLTIERLKDPPREIEL